ncbi:hypothetical protein KKB18_04370 [bacterium]|nr:hypothetical protein [bacterium]
MKTLFCFLIIGIILITLPVFSMMIIPDDMSGKPGEAVQIPVKIYQVNKPIEAFGTVFSFNPEILVYKGLSKLELTEEFDFLEGNEYSPGFIKIAGISRKPIPELSQGVFFSINFKVKNTAIPGKYLLTFADDISSGELSNIQFAKSEQVRSQGKIKSSGMPPYIPGKELGFFIWFNPDNETWFLSWGVNNSENTGALFTDDLKNATTQPATFTVLRLGEGNVKDDTEEIHSGLFHTFSGYIESDGDIIDFTQEGMEPADKFQMIGNNKIVFAAMEEILNDTLIFKTKGTNLNIGLKIDGEFLPKKIFIGAFRENPDSAQFSIEKPENSSLNYIKPSRITLE